MLTEKFPCRASIDEAVFEGDDAAKRGDVAAAERAYVAAAAEQEVPPAPLCLKLARCYQSLGNFDEAFAWVARSTDASDTFASWMGASSLLHQLTGVARPPARRRVKVAVTGTYTLTQLGALLRLAGHRRGLDLELYESGFAQYRQDIIDPRSTLYASEPDIVVLAVHEGAAELPQESERPEDDVAAEYARWTGLWQLVGERSGARIVQHNFALRPDPPLGNLARSANGMRHAMLHALNARIAESLPAGTHIVDCDAISAAYGKYGWFDDRYWHLAKQAVALDALPLLARHTAAVLAGSLGLSRKCLAFDLDNTIWGGVVGEDGLEGIELGATATGEAFVALQEYMLELKNRGVVLAVVSKNNEADAREVFERHPDMRLRADDIAIFIANWEDKATNLRRVAQELDLGLDALVLLDDNPAERQVVRRLLPDVEVLVVPEDATASLQVLSRSLLFEPGTFTTEDRARSATYRARAEAGRLRSDSLSLDDFYRSLAMEALVAPFDELHLPRIVQLIGKTNQLNLTTRRHSVSTVRAFMNDPRYVHLYLKLRDRFADHGLVALLIAEQIDDMLDIETLLMSCRVIGRTVERELLEHLCRRALELECRRLRGTYVPSPKNQVARELYQQIGFALVAEEDAGASTWDYDLETNGIVTNEFIGGWDDRRDS